MKNYSLILLLCFAGMAMLCCRQQEKKANTQNITIGSGNYLEQQLNKIIDTESRLNDEQINARLQAIAPEATTYSYRTRGLYNYLRGNLYRSADEDDSALACYKKMVPANIDTAGDADLIILQQTGLIKTGMKKKVDEQTFKLLLPLIDFARKYHYAKLWKVYNLAAEAYFQYGDTTLPEHYTRLSIENYPDKNDAYQLSIFMEELSRSAELVKDYKRAMLYEDSALHYALQINDPKRLATIYSALSVLYINTGDPGKGYPLMEQSFALKEKNNDVSFNDLMNMGLLYVEKAEYPKSVDFLQKALALAKKQKNTQMLNRAYGTLYELYYQLGDYKAAVRYLDSSGDAALKALQEQQYRQVAKMQAVSDLKEQQQKVEALNVENKNKATILGQQQIIIFILVAILILAAGIGYLLVERRRLRSEKNNIQLQQQLLRSQMEPHFIFNTLSVLQSFIRNNEQEKSVKYLNQFARLLRLNLENSRESLVALKDEVEALQNYLSLQSMRFEGVFEYTVSVYEGYEEDEAYIPPMLLQPFVENSIQHGMRNIAYKGIIDIRIKRKGQALYCIIEDNGIGLQATNKQTGKKSLSGIITQERLSILSRQTNQPASLTIIDKQAQGKTGLKVELVIPIQSYSNFKQA